MLKPCIMLRSGGEGGKALPILYHSNKTGEFSVNPPTLEMEEFLETCNSTEANFSHSLTHIKPQLYHSTIQHTDPIPNGCLQLFQACHPPEHLLETCNLIYGKSYCTRATMNGTIYETWGKWYHHENLNMYDTPLLCSLLCCQTTARL